MTSVILQESTLKFEIRSGSPQCEGHKGLRHSRPPAARLKESLKEGAYAASLPWSNFLHCHEHVACANMNRFAAAAFDLTVLTMSGCTAVLAKETGSIEVKTAKELFFICDEDVSFEGVFVDGQEAKRQIVILSEAAQPLTLPLVPAASGSRYNDGDLMIWGKGKEALVEQGGKPLCTGYKSGE